MAVQKQIKSQILVTQYRYWSVVQRVTGPKGH